jgi:hypothetical protein
MKDFHHLLEEVLGKYILAGEVKFLGEYFSRHFSHSFS